MTRHYAVTRLHELDGLTTAEMFAFRGTEGM
jgi:hypothetical protein